MEQQNSIGIYLMPEGAYCAAVSAKGSGAGMRCIFVPIGGTEQGQVVLTAMAREILRQAGPFDQAAVAVRSNLISQYYHHSEFAEAKQVESTIRFDTEEVAATDASTLAIAFEITASGPGGSDVTIFTASRQTLTDILLDIQAGGLDPSVMEPDVVCLTRCLERIDGFREPGAMYLLVFGRTCYLVTPVHPDFAPRVRTFLLPEDPDKTGSLARQIILTIAGLSEMVAVKKLVLVGYSEGIDKAQMNALTGLAVETVDLSRLLTLEIPHDVKPDQLNGFLFAAGSALALTGRTHRADFRRDFMPYQGRRRILQRSLQVVSVSVTILFLAMGLYFQVKAWRNREDYSRLQQKLNESYSAAMYGAKRPSSEPILSKLRRTLNTVKQQASGILDESSVTGRLTYVLESINNSPKTVDVNIKTITISDRLITIVGDTNSRTSTRELFDAFKKHKMLEVTDERFNTAKNRDEFVLTLKAKESQSK
ncbi:hypothetical protein ACQ9LF_11135 [Anaerohalosphaeraceae bacterium U12dextr]